MREGASLTCPEGRVRWEKKTDYPFSIQWVHSDQGVQKCCRAVKNLFTTPPSLWIWYTWWLILRENSACYCLHLASFLVVNAVFSNSNAVFRLVSLCNVVFYGRSKMSGSGSMQTKPVPAPWRGRKLKELSASDNCRMCGCCFKTQFNFKSGWISSENMFVAPTRKRETLPKLANLLKNKLFIFLDEGESLFMKVSSPCGTKVWNWAVLLSQIREKLNTPTDNANNAVF